MKKGTKFEILTEEIYRKLIKNHDYEEVKRNVLVNGKDGKRQIDVLVLTKTAGIELMTIIECKDHNRKVSIGMVDALHSKLQDINGNKAILVSSKGFSSKAISKAKRVGMTLCTAHQALSPKWQINIEIPILVKEIRVNEIYPSINFTVNRSADIKEIVENDKLLNQIHEIIINKWESNELELEITEDLQVLNLFKYLNELEIYDEKGAFGKIRNFEIEVGLKFESYFGYLNELDDAQLLNDITKSELILFIDSKSFQDYLVKLKKTNNKSIPESNKLSINVLVKQKFKLSRGDMVQIEQIN